MVLNNTAMKGNGRPLEFTLKRYSNAIENKFTALDSTNSGQTADIATNAADISTNASNIATAVENNVTYSNFKDYDKGMTLAFDGVDDYLYLDDLVTDLVQTFNNKGAILIDYTAPAVLAAKTLFCAGDTNADEKLMIEVSAAGIITVTCTDAGTDQFIFATDSAVITAGERHAIMLVQDGTAPALFINRTTPDITFSDETDKTSWFHELTGVDNVRLMCDNYNSVGNANFAQGMVHRFQAFTDVLSREESYELNMGGEIPYRLLGAATTEHLDEIDFASHAKWDVTNDFDDTSTAGQVDFVWSANQTSTLLQQDSNRVATGSPEKRYLFRYTVAVTTAPDGDFAMSITNAFASEAVDLDFTAGSKEVRFTSASGAVTGDLVISAVSGSDTEGTFSIDDVSLIQVGCICNLDYRGLANKQWRDPLKDTYGVINGADPVGMPVGHTEVYFMEGVGSNASAVVVPAGYRLDNIIIKETAGNAVTGNVEVGTAGGGSQVVNAEVVGASALVDATLVLNIFSLTAAQTLYVESSNWDSASINLYFVMTKLI